MVERSLLEGNKISKISDLKDGMENVSVKVRVIEVSKPKVIQTRRGPRTISEAIVGDESGRVKLTLWGRHAGSLKEGEVVEIRGAWTTSYRGVIQLNVGNRGRITPLSDDSAPQSHEIPHEMPRALNARRRGSLSKKYSRRNF